MKKNFCRDTYFNREVCGYIEMLLSADKLLTNLEESFEKTPGEALKVSRDLDLVIAGIMEKRNTVSQILLADSSFN